MSSFLSGVADHILEKHKDSLGDCTVVFPNRRAGLFLKKHLSQKVDKSKNDLEILKAERLHLEHRVKLLSPESLDLDLLDEQARKLLGYSKVGETVYSYQISEK